MRDGVLCAEDILRLRVKVNPGDINKIQYFMKMSWGSSIIIMSDYRPERVGSGGSKGFFP
jgi:hypothetical protein